MIFVILTTYTSDEALREPHLEEQRRYRDDLFRRGVLIAAGPFDDHTGGMLLVDVNNIEEAIAIARSNPLVAAGVKSYQVRGWSSIYDPDRRLLTKNLREEQGSRPEPSGPMVVPPSEENFHVVDASDDPKFEDVVVRCFARRQISAGDPARTNYLRLAKGRGWTKLLLLHEDAVAGQIEFATPEASGLPIQGDGLTIIHCLWILDAYTGLDGSRRLLAACAEANPEANGLATVAYNSDLAWLPRSLFERQGFATIDQLETGRFCGETPIAAYLMWRPLADGAQPPTWNREQMVAGVDFCPAYPWMFGRRLYWGRQYPYRARVVKEGLRRPEILEQFPILATRCAEHWTLVEIGIPQNDLGQAVQRLQRALIAEPTYYAYIYGDEDRDELIVIYPYREYRVGKDSQSWGEAIRYGLDKGIPREELEFPPTPLDEPTTR